MILENNNRLTQNTIDFNQNRETAHFGWDIYVQMIDGFIQKILLSKNEDVMEQYKNRICDYIKEKVFLFNKNYSIYQKHINMLEENFDKTKTDIVQHHMDRILTKYNNNNMKYTSFLDQIKINIFLKKDPIEEIKENLNDRMDDILDKIYLVEEQYQTSKKEQDFAILNLMDYMKDDHEGFLSYRFLNRQILIFGQMVRNRLKKEYKYGTFPYEQLDKIIILLEKKVIQLKKELNES